MAGLKVVKVSFKEVGETISVAKAVSELPLDKLFAVFMARLEQPERFLYLLGRNEKDEAVALIEAQIDAQDSLLGRRHVGVISFVYVVEGQRRHGFGKKLVEAAGFWFLGRDVKEVRFTVPEPGDAASLTAFFRALGYAEAPAFAKRIGNAEA